MIATINNPKYKRVSADERTYLLDLISPSKIGNVSKWNKGMR